ncbi:unnamed protein product [Calypogeia fissa]
MTMQQCEMNFGPATYRARSCFSVYFVDVLELLLQPIQDSKLKTVLPFYPGGGRLMIPSYRRMPWRRTTDGWELPKSLVKFMSVVSFDANWILEPIGPTRSFSVLVDIFKLLQEIRVCVEFMTYCRKEFATDFAFLCFNVCLGCLCASQ